MKSKITKFVKTTTELVDKVVASLGLNVVTTIDSDDYRSVEVDGHGLNIRVSGQESAYIYMSCQFDKVEMEDRDDLIYITATMADGTSLIFYGHKNRQPVKYNNISTKAQISS